MKSRTQVVFEKVCKTTEKINRDRLAIVPDLCSQVRDVVVVASSSRGGSSIFTEILRCSPELLHFKGEINPFLALAGLCFPYNGRSGDMLEEADVGPHNSDKLARFEKEMAFDVGISDRVDLNEIGMLTRFMNDLHWRICVQWPELDIDKDFLFSQVRKTLDELYQRHGWEKGIFSDPQLFHTLFLKNLRKKYQAINPYYYDLRPDLVRQYCPDAQEDFDSPSSFIIEEPPFVPIVPRQYISSESVRSKPLVLKTPSNVYRLAFLKKVFPNARFRILHLVRNPADSINGLVDGWRYNGFFSHRLQQKLEIQGYSDISPLWGKNWWKYDLPPGWEKLTNRPLEYVCGYQWLSAHRKILDYLEGNQTDCLRVKFENVIGPIENRRDVFSRICQWLGIEGQEIINAAIAEELPPVMVTTTLSPRKRRWFKKAELIRPVLTDSDMKILSTAKTLGYTLNEEISS